MKQNLANLANFGGNLANFGGNLASEFGPLLLILARAFGSFQPKFAKCATFPCHKNAPTLNT